MHVEEFGQFGPTTSRLRGATWAHAWLIRLAQSSTPVFDVLWSASSAWSARLTRLGLAWITSKLFKSDPGQIGSGHSSWFEQIQDNVLYDMFECNFNCSVLNPVRMEIPTVKIRDSNGYIKIDYRIDPINETKFRQDNPICRSNFGSQDLWCYIWVR